MDAPSGQDIMGVGSRLIATRGAAPLDDAGTILRWERVAPARFADGTATVKTVDYLLPVPGAPTRGLWLQTSILAEAGGTRVDDEGIAFMTALSDAIVASVRWKRDAAYGGLVLLLCEPQSGLYGTLILMATDVPPITDAARAERLALTITPSDWPPTTVPIMVQNEPGWRISVLMPGEDDDDGGPTTLSSARTAYVFAIGGSLAVAQLSPLPVEAAAVAMALTEQMLPTIGLSHDV